MVPTYNEVEILRQSAISRAIIEWMAKSLPEYDYEIVFIDNWLTDGTRDVIRSLCKKNPKIKTVLNVTDFGQFNSSFYGFC